MYAQGTLLPACTSAEPLQAHRQHHASRQSGGPYQSTEAVCMPAACPHAHLPAAGSLAYGLLSGPLCRSKPGVRCQVARLSAQSISAAASSAQLAGLASLRSGQGSHQPRQAQQRPGRPKQRPGLDAQTVLALVPDQVRKQSHEQCLPVRCTCRVSLWGGRASSCPPTACPGCCRCCLPWLDSPARFPQDYSAVGDS